MFPRTFTQWILTLSIFSYHFHDFRLSSFVTGSLHFSYVLIIYITYHDLHLLLDPYTFQYFHIIFMTYHNLHLLLDPYTFIIILSFWLIETIFVCYWILTLSLFFFMICIIPDRPYLKPSFPPHQKRAIWLC